MIDLRQLAQKLHDRLRRTRTLLQTTERLAGELRTLHDAWTARLAETQPGQDARQTASAALELALQDLERSLPPASSSDASSTCSREEATASPRRHIPPA